MTAALEIRDLRYAYRDQTPALHGVDLAIQENECVGLVGPNGAGKSTLLLHLNGILPECLNGTANIFVFGQPLTSASVNSIRRQVGLLFQDTDDQLFCPTVFEDVAFGPGQFGLDPKELTRRVADALARVGLDGFEKRCPQHLSNGEKRRVCLAGVLACEPRLLVLDEPTSDLDPRGKRELKELLRKIPVTRIIATHDLEMVVELCPRTVVLDGGRVVADGATEELLADQELMLAHGLECPHILRHRHPH